ncbi:MAG: hypothetical protein KAW12_07545 [Candidatus Aminicenantes bacterium]|nr:hypothetical protein [Candidatus Aminicenantes bacterium]
MVEKVKNFFAALASFAVFFYATGFLAEYAHDRMLGISMVEPAAESYLISGGKFVLSTLYALFSTIFSRFYYFIFFFILAAVFLHFEARAKEKKAVAISKTYYTSVLVLTLIFLFFVIPLFTSPFAFSGLLLDKAEPAVFYKPFEKTTADLWTWMLNGNPVNKAKLTHFYVLLVLSTAVSAVLLYSMVKRRQRMKGSKEDEKPSKADAALTLKQKAAALFKTYRCVLPRFFYDLLLLLMVVVVLVQLFTIPLNYGILLKSNHYPAVRLEAASSAAGQPGVEILADRLPGSDYKMWLLRENDKEIMVYAVFIEKKSGQQAYKLLILKKAQIGTIEILGYSSIFEFK